MSGLVEDEASGTVQKTSESVEPVKELTLAAETADEFWKIYNQQIQSTKGSFQHFLSSHTNVSETEKQKKLAEFKAVCDNLQQYVTLSTIALPPYDRKRSQEIIEGLKKEYKDLDNTVMPKKKFTFSSRNKATATASSSSSAATATEAPVPAAEPPKEDKSHMLLPPGSYILSKRSNEEIYLPSPPEKDQLVGGDGSSSSGNSSKVYIQLYMKDNECCKIKMPWLSGSVRLENISNCEIYLGPTMTSVYLENVQDSIIYVYCHQLRIHNCKGCRLYVKVNSHPIIEDCSDIGFAPYDLSYTDVEADSKEAALEQASCWDNVKDFRWLKSIKSPNWFVIEEADRRSPPSF